MKHHELSYTAIAAAGKTLGIAAPEMFKALESIGFEHVADCAGMQRDVPEPPEPGE